MTATEVTEVLSEKLAVLGSRLPGFRFAETMAGYAEVNGQRRDMSFRVEARATDLGDHLRTGRTEIRGAVTVAGLAQDAPLHGDLWILPLRERAIRYRFLFRDLSGRPLRFVGQKDLRLLRLPSTLTTLPGEILDESGQTVARTTLHFPLTTLRAFLTSFRPLF